MEKTGPSTWMHWQYKLALPSVPESPRASLLDVFLQLIRVRSPVEEDLLHARIGQKFEGVFDNRGICEWQKALIIWFVNSKSWA